MTLGKAPSIPATATMALASASSSRCASRRCRPATPQSVTRSTRLPSASATSAASSATGRSAVPAAATTTRPMPSRGSGRARMSRPSGCQTCGNPAPATPATIASPPLQEQVRRAGLEAREVDGDVDVAQLAEASDDRLVPPVLPQPRHLVAADLQSRQPVVVAHAELAEAERPHEGLGGVDLAQLLRGDAVAVLESRR